MKQTLINKLLTALLILLLGGGSGVAQEEGFSKLIVFGDSLSDTGNLAFVDLPPPYFENRISDGPVIADLIAEAIGSSAQASGHLLGSDDGFNYAVAGGNIKGSDLEDLSQQISAHLQRVGNRADPNALYLVFAGGNDLREIRSLSSSTQASAEILLTVNTFEGQLNRLKNAGARAFLIPNVPNVGRIPETLERESDDPGISVRAENYVREYNQVLIQMLSRFGAPRGLSVSAFNLFQAFENLLDNASDFGFTNITEGCFDPDEFRVELECLILGFESRVFFDSIHPSSATNRIIAAQAITVIPELPTEQQPAVAIAPVLSLLL